MIMYLLSNAYLPLASCKSIFDLICAGVGHWAARTKSVNAYLADVLPAAAASSSQS